MYTSYFQASGATPHYLKFLTRYVGSHRSRTIQEKVDLFNVETRPPWNITVTSPLETTISIIVIICEYFRFSNLSYQRLCRFSMPRI
jgi:hypothetical protein